MDSHRAKQRKHSGQEQQLSYAAPSALKGAGDARGLGDDPIKDADESFNRHRAAIVEGFRKILTDQDA